MISMTGRVSFETRSGRNYQAERFSVGGPVAFARRSSADDRFGQAWLPTNTVEKSRKTRVNAHATTRRVRLDENNRATVDSEGGESFARRMRLRSPALDLAATAMMANIEARLFGGPHTPVRIGRYELIERIGEGGMGVVFTAVDPVLDRTVALKLLHASRDCEPVGTRRLLREAQALARVSHPNVVQVHEVGVHEDSVFIAMEYVEGTRLVEWQDAPHGWRAIARMYVEVGRGLAAVHHAGVVHRDFKPHNVVVDAEGRPRLLDFGLALTGSLATSDSREITAPMMASCSGASAERLTATGAIVGTAAYMSPEQFEIKPTDARSDQFAFCVALFEAIYRARPFPGETVPVLCASVCEGEIVVPREAPALPRWFVQTLRRGLAREPRQRFSSMDELLARLDRGLDRRARVVTAACALGVLTGILGALGGGEYLERSRVDARATRIDACVQRLDLALASPSGQPQYGVSAELSETAPGRHLLERLDAFVHAWRAVRDETCEQVADGVSTRPAETCLAGDAAGFAATLTQLDVAESQRDLAEALEVLEELPDPARCVGARERTPARATSITRELVAAKFLRKKHRHADAVALTRKLVGEARTLGTEEVLIRALAEHARALRAARQTERAEAVIREAYAEASAIGDARARVELELLRMDIALDRQDVLAASRSYGWIEGALDSADAGVETLLAEAYEAYGQALRQSGEIQRARELFERALTIRARRFGETGHFVASSMHSIGSTYADEGDAESALEWFERSLAIRERIFGPSHPRVADSLVALAIAETQGRPCEAAPGVNVHAHALLTRALEIWSAESDPAVLARARIHGRLAYIERDCQNLVSAEAHSRAQIGLYTELAAHEVPRAERVEALHRFAEIQSTRGAMHDALETLADALALNPERLGTSGEDALIDLRDSITSRLGHDKLDAPSDAARRLIQ